MEKRTEIERKTLEETSSEVEIELVTVNLSIAKGRGCH